MGRILRGLATGIGVPVFVALVLWAFAWARAQDTRVTTIETRLEAVAELRLAVAEVRRMVGETREVMAEARGYWLAVKEQLDAARECAP